MDHISIDELIISCESCGTVKKFKVNSQADCDKIFHNFRCENNCGRSLYSFIEVGTIERNSLSTSLNTQHAVASE
ncbi:hypothetical protein H8E88_19815 [candidate division KSB1 bacterium]|nr:hypothetical protein [candidate division KSB1 bacterium]